MDLDVDSSTILYAVGAVFGAAAVLYFSWEIILDLSPTVKSSLLLAGFAGFLLSAMYTSSVILEKTLYVLSSVSYLSFLVYTIGKFSLVTEEIFLALGLSSVLFIGLGYLIRERDASLEPSAAKKGLLVVLALGAVLVAVDVLGAQPTYEASFVDEVNATETGDIRVGEVTVRNDFVLSRDVDLPRYSACTYFPDRRRNILSTADAPSVIAGGATETVDLKVRVPVRVINGTPARSGPGLVPVQQMQECPESSDERKIVVTEGDWGRFRD